MVATFYHVFAISVSHFCDTYILPCTIVKTQVNNLSITQDHLLNGLKVGDIDICCCTGGAIFCCAGDCKPAVLRWGRSQCAVFLIDLSFRKISVFVLFNSPHNLLRNRLIGVVRIYPRCQLKALTCHHISRAVQQLNF